MTTKLGLWNNALLDLGHATLSDTGETVEAGRVLTVRYDRVVADCLSAGSWNFAMEDVALTGDTGLITSRVGYQYGFARPSDWLRTEAVSGDEYFTAPLLHYYMDRSGLFKADTTPLYLRYVSNDTGAGLDLARWPAAFVRYVELELAVRAAPKLTEDKSLKEELKKERDKARKTALNQDAMNEAQPKFAPPGSWTRARGAGSRERGDKSTLTE